MDQNEANPSRDARSRCAAQFRDAGESAGRSAVGKLERSTRRVIQELLGGLQRELLSSRSAPRPARGAESPSRARHAPPPAAAVSGASASDRAVDGRAGDPAPTRPALEQIQERFRNAVSEWKLLLHEIQAVEHEIAETTFEKVFGNLFPDDGEAAAGDPSAGRDADAGDAPPASPAPRPASAEGAARHGAAIACDDSPGATRAGGEARLQEARQLEHKLDQLIDLVRDHVLRGERVDPARLPADWTRSVAREVANRLRESFPLSGELGTPRAGRDPEHPTPPAKSNRISLDDVAAMIDQITGRNG
jgi:hypothetical protein